MRKERIQLRWTYIPWRAHNLHELRSGGWAIQGLKLDKSLLSLGFPVPSGKPVSCGAFQRPAAFSPPAQTTNHNFLFIHEVIFNRVTPLFCKVHH